MVGRGGYTGPSFPQGVAMDRSILSRTPAQQDAMEALGNSLRRGDTHVRDFSTRTGRSLVQKGLLEETAGGYRARVAGLSWCEAVGAQRQEAEMAADRLKAQTGFAFDTP